MGDLPYKMCIEKFVPSSPEEESSLKRWGHTSWAWNGKLYVIGGVEKKHESLKGMELLCFDPGMNNCNFPVDDQMQN